MDLEAEDLGDVTLHGLDGDESGVNLEQDVLEGSAEVSAVDGGVAAGFRVVDVLAFAAVELDRLDVGQVGHAGWEERLGFADHAGTFAEVGLLVFLELEKGGLG